DETDAPRQEFALKPSEGFATSDNEQNGGDDWTAVRVDGDPNANWGALKRSLAQPQIGNEGIIIQHPGGGPKKIALSHNVLTYVDDRRLQYLTDTLEGSSGSPIFDTEWQLIGIHHKGGMLREPGTKMTVYRNQGVHINILLSGLKNAKLS